MDSSGMAHSPLAAPADTRIRGRLLIWAGLVGLRGKEDGKSRVRAATSVSSHARHNGIRSFRKNSMQSPVKSWTGTILSRPREIGTQPGMAPLSAAVILSFAVISLDVPPNGRPQSFSLTIRRPMSVTP